jgi:hypothetical protein
MTQSFFQKGNKMYARNSQVRQPQVRMAVGASGHSMAAELIRQGKARRLGIGRQVGIGNFYCPPTSPVSGPCKPPVTVCPENQKRYYMPFVPQAGYTASVAAGATVIFVGRPQKLFSPDRLIIGSTIGAYFDVVSPQSLSAGNVGAEMFSEVATYVMMTFDQAYPGIDIILTAQNKSSVTQTFQAQLVGEAVG